jgi:hypothetical protein
MMGTTGFPFKHRAPGVAFNGPDPALPIFSGAGHPSARHPVPKIRAADMTELRHRRACGCCGGITIERCRFGDNADYARGRFEVSGSGRS